MKVLITGADGFIGKNLVAHLSERADIEIIKLTQEHNLNDLSTKVAEADFIFHIAGINRPKEVSEFQKGNAEFTEILCDAIQKSGKKIPVLFTSSIQAKLDNAYGDSKKIAESSLLKLQDSHQSNAYIYRLPNVFGKWAKPNYNSVVATFCHNIANDLPITINDSEAKIELVYIDDVISSFVNILDNHISESGFIDITPTYQVTLGDLATQLEKFRDSRSNLITEEVGTGFVRALYSTYVSYLQPNSFSYAVPRYGDDRGVFVEMLKTPNAGQFSFFTAHPGITRGGHYHHSKTEKFLVIKGKALFRFKHILSDEYYELTTSGETPEIVETVPGWTHDVTNIGNDELIVMLWANEIFDRAHPDTYMMKIEQEIK